MIKGAVCDFDFYVIGLSTMKEYGEKYYIKNIEDVQYAVECFKDAVSKYPKAVIAIGVAYKTHRRDLGKYTGEGACDLVQWLGDKIHFSDDCKRSEVLMQESLITVNVMNILKEQLQN